MKLLHIIEFIIHNDEFYNARTFNKKSLLQYSKNIQKGVSKEKIIKYNNEEFKFIYLDDDNDLFILESLDKKSECIVIGIDKKRETMFINNITADNDIKCFKQVTYKKGTLLLELSIKFVKKMKETEFPTIKKIILTDNSQLFCNDLSKSIPLSNIKQIITGDTFYGKYGFTPINKNDIKNYNHNKDVLQKLKLKDFNLCKYLDNFYLENKKTIKEESINKLNEFIKINDDLKLSDFFNLISNKENFDDNCMLIDYLINRMYRHYNLKSMYHVNYELIL